MTESFNRKQGNNPPSKQSFRKTRKKQHKYNAVAKTVIIVFLITISSFLLYLMLNKNSNDNLAPVRANKMITNQNISRIELDDKYELLTVSPIKITENKKEVVDKTLEPFNEIYIENKKTKIKTLLKDSDKLLSLVFLDKKSHFKDNNDSKFIILYEYTKAKSNDGTERRIIEKGYVFDITENKPKEIYKTFNLFGSAIIDNGKIIIYERLPRDKMNLYPSYLKPYDRIKMVYEKGNFVEKDRTYIEPVQEYKEKSNR